MYDYQLSVTVSDQQWASTSAHVNVAQTNKEFFAQFGAEPEACNSRRQFRRVRARGRAIALLGELSYGILTDNVSRFGFGFYSPVPILPKQKLSLCFEQAEPVELTIRRCYRTDNQGYSCGGVFAEGPMTPRDFRDFLSAFKS